MALLMTEMCIYIKVKNSIFARRRVNFFVE